MSTSEQSARGRRGDDLGSIQPLPGDVPVSPTAARLVDLLRPHTPFAEAIVRRQAERAGLSLPTLQEADLAKLGPLVYAASSVFLDPPARELLRRALGIR
jgi:hypothetical protein